MNSALVLIVAGAVGACIGSFVVTAAQRTARGEPFLHGRSHCDGCGSTVGFARSLPLISYPLAGGVCAVCRAPIPVLHPLAEIAGVLLGLAAAAGDVPAQIVLASGGLALMAPALAMAIAWR